MKLPIFEQNLRKLSRFWHLLEEFHKKNAPFGALSLCLHNTYARFSAFSDSSIRTCPL